MKTKEQGKTPERLEFLIEVATRSVYAAIEKLPFDTSQQDLAPDEFPIVAFLEKRIFLMMKWSIFYEDALREGKDLDFSQSGLDSEEVEEIKSGYEPLERYLEEIDTNPSEMGRHRQWMKSHSSPEEYEKATDRLLVSSIMRKVRRAESQKAKKQTS